MTSPNFFEKNAHRIELGAPTGCWLWAGAQIPDGYGSVFVEGRQQGTHRLAYEAKHGVGSANGLLVRHRCDTPACINPDHLVLGTPAQNSKDAVERDRMARGERVAGVRLTADDVVAIRARYRSGDSQHGQRPIAREYGVSQRAISFLLSGRTWRHV